MTLSTFCFRFWRRYLVFLLMAGLSKGMVLMAQPYPVTTIVQVTQFSALPEDYDDPGRVFITLISTDARPEYPALLRLKLSGPGFSIGTREDYLPTPLILRRNQPLVLSGAQLREYFNPMNLDFGGIDQTMLLAGGGILPEGPVSLCAEVYDYNRFFDPPVSNSGCASGFVQLHRPPVLIEPEGDVPVIPIQQVRFVWQAMHSGLTARYTLEIYENNLTGFSPDLVLLSTPPLAVIQTMPPFYLYTNLDPLLLPGQSYLVRIRAEDVTGQATFINNGWSEIYSFHYGITSAPPESPQAASSSIPDPVNCNEAPNIQDLAASPITSYSANLAWRSPTPIHPDAYSIRYRKTSDLDFGTPITIPDTTYSLQGLSASRQYEVRVCYTCQTPEDRCDTLFLSTLEANCALAATDDYSYSCGDSTAVVPSGDAPLMTTLHPGDTVWAGDFLVILSEVSGAGVFRGTGYVSAPYFEQARLRLSFNNIRVNRDCRMIAGQMDVTGAGLAVLDRLNELIDQIMDQLDQLDNILTQIEEALLIAQEIVEAAATLADYTQSKKDALAAIAQASAEFPFLPDSLSQHIQEALNCMNAAQTEAQFLACREQMMAALAAYQAAVNALYQNAPHQVHFIESPQQAYGFDPFSHEVLTDQYTHLNIANLPYHVSWKSTPITGNDRVNAYAQEGLSGITFVTKSRALLPRTDSAGVATLTVTGGTYKGPPGVVYAQHTGVDSTDVHIAGQLHVAAYPEKPLKIVLVPVNGVAPPEAVVNDLTKVFKQAIIQPEVSIHAGLQLPDFNNTLSDAASGLFANYNADMRELIRAFERNTDPAPETYYVFLVANCSAPNRLGFMPRGRKYGFVFVNNHASEQASVARTIAHELAHGAYYLKHTFEQYPELSTGSTNNLMDYANGIHLHKYQWDLIHDPNRDWGIFDGDDEAAGETAVIARNFIYSGNIYYQYTGSAGDYTCLTPSGQLYAIPKNAVAAFHPAFNEWPAGALVGYKLGNETYYGWRRNGQFMGYATAKEGLLSLGPNEYAESGSVNRDSVYAGLTDTICHVAILRGPMATAETYDVDNPLPPIETLPIEHFVVIENAPHLSPECLTDDEHCRQIYADHPYLQPESNDPISNYVKAHPCILGTLTHFDFEPYNTQSEWMQGFNQVFGTLLALGAAPVAAEFMGPYLANFGREKIVEAGVGFSFDILLQATLKYWFPPGEPITVLQSFQGLDYYQASASAVEAMIASSGWRGVITSVGMSCAVDGLTQQGVLRDSVSLGGCLKGAGSALIIGSLFQAVPALKNKLKTVAKPVLVGGLLRILAEIPSLPSGKAWDFYRLIHPERIQSEDVIHLFDISPERAGDIADHLQSSTSLQNLLRDDDWWTEVRKFSDSPDLRGQLLEDLAGDLNLAQAFKEKPELVRAWGVVFRAELSDEIRRSHVDLSTIDNYLNTTGKDPIEFAAELAANTKTANATPRSWFDVIPNGGGAVIGQRGDYVVREEGEVFYRAIYPHNYSELIVTGRLPGTSETSTSPSLSFSDDYRGVLLKYYLRHGTIDQLVQHGRKAHDNLLIIQQFGDMPLAPSGWITQYVCFKKEGGNSMPQVNIQLGIGPGISIFNDNLIAFEVIR